MELDLEDDFEINPTFIELVKTDWEAHMVWAALCTKMWFKLRTINKDEVEQALEVLSADLTDRSRMWNCSSRYAGEMIADLRNTHHGCDDDYTNWAFRGHAIPSPDIIAAFRAMGWIEVPYE